ncbi:MAG: BON domain-containing protein [Pirellulales bacterium]
MSPRLLTLAILSTFVLADPSIALAQGRGGAGTATSGASAFRSSMGGMGGGFGSSIGRSGSLGAGGMSGFGAGGFGNSMGGMGGMSGGFGNSGFGASGFGNSGRGGIGGGQYGGGQSFVGRDAADMQGTFAQSNRASTQFFNNMNRQMARQNRQQKAQTASKNPSQVMRIEVQVGFDATPPAPSVVASKLQTRLAKILADHHMSMPIVTVQGDTAVITGVAKSASERDVIGQLVSLEQGVRAVRNDMTVPGELPIEDIAPPPGS